ncbi:hypothetical protein [Agathobaculum desmolans]|uniref:hypothetical protein n=1 Tax=Agathobaculum desmolans TaxID=39484 RepID=UPI00248D8A70|nr:hypothetical protein [Agathobaculum desmolans]
MSSMFRPVLVGMMVLMMMNLTLGRVCLVTNDRAEDEVSYALKTATQDATAVLIDQNHMMDGNEMDAGNFKINLDDADAQFKDSFARNVGAFVSPVTVTSMNIPLTGYVGYRYVYGHMADGTATFPYAYTTVKDDKVYGFTMGDAITVTNSSGGQESEVMLSALPEYFFHAEIKNADFRTITIMETISDFLTQFNATGNNLMMINAGSGLMFQLGGVDFTNGDPSQLVNFSAVIDGPGYFAITDFFDPQLDKQVRTFTFGGAEYISKFRK